MKLHEFLKLIKGIPLKITFIPDGTIKYRKDTRLFLEPDGRTVIGRANSDQLEHFSELLSVIKHGGLYGPPFLDKFELKILQGNLVDSKMISFKNESINNLSHELLATEVKKIMTLEMIIRTNSTGSISYSETKIEIEI